MSERSELFEDISNPLDSVEEILASNDWVFDRMNEDELTVHVSGKMGTYRLFFVWQEEYSAMQFCCQYDISLPAETQDFTAKMLSAINCNLWLGHFDLRAEESAPCFRHTSLFRGMTYNSGAEHIEDLVDIALSECERYYPVFHLLSTTGMRDQQALTLAMMDSRGES